jgi:sec-independent protein translocase protein TatC
LLKSARKEGKREKDPGGRMPLAEHLRELRNRLMKAVLAILVVTIVAMIYYKQIAGFLTDPVRESVGCTKGFGRA